MRGAAAIPDGRAARWQLLRTVLLGTKAARIAPFLVVILAGTIIIAGLVGYAVALSRDAHLEVERHDALRAALDELHAVFGDVDRFDAAQLRLIERRAGLKDLQ